MEYQFVPKARSGSSSNNAAVKKTMDSWIEQSKKLLDDSNAASIEKDSLADILANLSSLKTELEATEWMYRRDSERRTYK